MNESTYCITPLDQKLQELACQDWASFVHLVGTDKITKAKICLLKKEQKSLGYIANRLSITKRKAQIHSKKCNC
jgi:hypothetical protein